MLLQVPVLHGLIGLRHVHPEVQNSCLSYLTVFRIQLVLESLLKMLLYRPHNVTLLREIAIVPALIRWIIELLILRSVVQQMIEKINGKNFNFLKRLKFGDVHMGTFGDVKENSIHKVQEDFKLKVLAP